MNNPKISIIVPVYNAEQYIDRCVRSILNQTFIDIEIILIDDGSTDNSSKICDKFARDYNNIVVIHKKNGGASSARNAGIDIAKGSYIGFVDSDDWIDNDMYQTLIEVTEQYDAEISQCGCRSVYDDHIEEANTEEIIVCDNLSAINYYCDNYKHFDVLVVNKLYSKRIFENLRFIEGIIHEDEIFTYKAIFTAKKLVSINQSKYNYYKSRTDSVMTKKFNKSRLIILDALKGRISFLRENGLYESAEKSQCEYFLYLLTCYYNTWKYISNNGDILKNIEKEITSNFKSIYKNRYLKAKKIKFIIFWLSPSLFISIFRLYLKIRRYE